MIRIKPFYAMRLAAVGLLAGALSSAAVSAPQQPLDSPVPAAGEATRSTSGGLPTAPPEVGVSQDELQRLAAEAARGDDQSAMNAPTAVRGQIDFMSLLLQGGALMVPIGLMSLLVVAVSLERLFALRSGALLPRGLRRELARARETPAQQIPELLVAASNRYRCVASRILADMLPKIGRPLPELEATISESAQHEADRLYNNVRWLTLAAAVTPLIGLLGTVWGMIIAFYNTTQLGAGTNKAEFLAEGIYVALVTTLGGLAVAIPAAICAHYFEGRITNTIAAIEKELKRLGLRLEPLEGKMRWDVQGGAPVSTSLATEQSPKGKESSRQRRRTAVG